MRIAWDSFEVKKKTLVVLHYRKSAKFDPPNGPLDFIYLSTWTVRRNRDLTSHGFVYAIPRAKSCLVVMDLTLKIVWDEAQQLSRVGASEASPLSMRVVARKSGAHSSVRRQRHTPSTAWGTRAVPLAIQWGGFFMLHAQPIWRAFVHPVLFSETGRRNQNSKSKSGEFSVVSVFNVIFFFKVLLGCIVFPFWLIASSCTRAGTIANTYCVDDIKTRGTITKRTTDMAMNAYIWVSSHLLKTLNWNVRIDTKFGRQRMVYNSAKQ